MQYLCSCSNTQRLFIKCSMLSNFKKMEQSGLGTGTLNVEVIKLLFLLDLMKPRRLLVI